MIRTPAKSIADIMALIDVQGLIFVFISADFLPIGPGRYLAEKMIIPYKKACIRKSGILMISVRFTITRKIWMPIYGTHTDVKITFIPDLLHHFFSEIL